MTALRAGRVWGEDFHCIILWVLVCSRRRSLRWFWTSCTNPIAGISASRRCGVTLSIHPSSSVRLPQSTRVRGVLLLRCSHIMLTSPPDQLQNCARFRNTTLGPLLPHGPWDSLELHGKAWIIEDDSRTTFAFDPPTAPVRYGESCLACRRRRYLLLASPSSPPVSHYHE